MASTAPFYRAHRAVKRRYYLAAHRRVVNVLTSNTFLESPTPIWLFTIQLL